MRFRCYEKRQPRRPSQFPFSLRTVPILQAISAASDEFPYEHVHRALAAYLPAHPGLAAVAAAALAVASDAGAEMTDTVVTP